MASNALRSRSRRREVGVPEGNGADSSPLALDQLAKAASGFMPTRALDKAEQAEMVRHAVAALSERQRMALLLAKFEGHELPGHCRSRWTCRCRRSSRCSRGPA